MGKSGRQGWFLWGSGLWPEVQMRRSHPYESLREGRFQAEEPTYTKAKGRNGLGLFKRQDKGQCAWNLVILSKGDVCAESQRTRAC